MTRLCIVLLCTTLAGCATPGVLFTATDNTLKVTPVPATGLLAWLVGSNLPAGDYECQFEEFKKAKFSTKTDMKLLDLNLSKVGD